MLNLFQHQNQNPFKDNNLEGFFFIDFYWHNLGVSAAADRAVHYIFLVTFSEEAYRTKQTLFSKERKTKKDAAPIPNATRAK
jgi:hypothetical protein